MTLGTGVGGGVIADGNLIHGVGGAGGEIGHIIVEAETGFECTWKQGCLETVASATGVVRLARHLAEGYEGDSSIKAAVDNGEQVTSKIFSLLPKATNLLIASLTKSLNTSDLQQQISQIFLTRIQLIGGGVSAAGEFLRSRVEGYFTRYAFPQVRRATKVKLAELGNDAELLVLHLQLITNE